MSNDEWQDIPPVDGIPEPHRSRMLAFYEECALVDQEARSLFDEHGWERVNALTSRVVCDTPRLAVLIRMGSVVDDFAGAVAALDHHAREQVRAGEHVTAVVLRLMAISAASCGPPGDPAAVNGLVALVEALRLYVTELRLELPTSAEWDAANVDAALLEAELTDW